MRKKYGWTQGHGGRRPSARGRARRRRPRAPLRLAHHRHRGARGLCFGYDAGVISSAPDFRLDSFGQQAVVASLLLAAVSGALGGGPLSDHLGRKRTLLLAATVLALVDPAGGASAPILQADADTSTRERWRRRGA